MKHVDPQTLKPAKASDRKAVAISAFDEACRNPDFADWRAVAELLRAALPAAKVKPAAETVTDSRYTAFSDYVIPANATKKLGRSPVVVVTFADGETVRAPAVSLPGKPVNIGRGIRVALAFYQGRIAQRSGRFITDVHFIAGLSIPDVVSCICETSGAEYDPAQCNDVMRAAIAPPAVPVDATEYTNDDKAAIFGGWLGSRRGLYDAILAACGESFIPSERGERMAFAVHAFWPDLQDSDLKEPEPVAKAAPAIAARFLASTSIVRDIPRLPVAPSCALRLVA